MSISGTRSVYTKNVPLGGSGGFLSAHGKENTELGTVRLSDLSIDSHRCIGDWRNPPIRYTDGQVVLANR